MKLKRFNTFQSINEQAKIGHRYLLKTYEEDKLISTEFIYLEKPDLTAFDIDWLEDNQKLEYKGFGKWKINSELDKTGRKYDEENKEDEELIVQQDENNIIVEYSKYDLSKDEMRINDMVEKSKDEEHLLKLAKTMANSIKNPEKAHNRALAAEDQNYNDIAKIFFDRAEELGHYKNN